MTEKLTTIAIFWLPLIAGIILGGMSPSVWYGGDKISALWMTFFGIVLLLLTAAFQIQSYIQTTILQPQLDVLRPSQRWILTWNPPRDDSMNVQSEDDKLPPGGWRAPTFDIVNKTSVNAQDVTIKWSAAKYDPTSLVAGKPIFQGREVSIKDSQVVLSAPRGVPFQHGLKFSASLEKPFVTRTAETYIPLDVWNTAALYFLATLAPEVGARSEPYNFDLEITWNIPANTAAAHFRVKAVATNITPVSADPVFRASIDFTVEPVARRAD